MGGAVASHKVGYRKPQTIAEERQTEVEKSPIEWLIKIQPTAIQMTAAAITIESQTAAAECRPLRCELGRTVITTNHFEAADAIESLRLCQFEAGRLSV